MKLRLHLNFLLGGKIKNLMSSCKAALSPDNLELLDFFQSDQCKQIFVENKLKINVESSNIYYDNTDTNEGILDFIFNQKNPIKNFTYGDSYKDYFNWLMTGFDSYEKARLDVLKFKMRNIYFIVLIIFLANQMSQLKKPNIVS